MVHENLRNDIRSPAGMVDPHKDGEECSNKRLIEDKDDRGGATGRGYGGRGCEGARDDTDDAGASSSGLEPGEYILPVFCQDPRTPTVFTFIPHPLPFARTLTLYVCLWSAFFVYNKDTPKADSHQAQSRERDVSDLEADGPTSAVALAERGTRSRSVPTSKAEEGGTIRLGDGARIFQSSERSETRAAPADSLRNPPRKSHIATPVNQESVHWARPHVFSSPSHALFLRHLFFYFPIPLLLPSNFSIPFHPLTGSLNCPADTDRFSLPIIPLSRSWSALISIYGFRPQSFIATNPNRSKTIQRPLKPIGDIECV